MLIWVSVLVTASLVIGALGASAVALPSSVASMFTAFGGGILLAAVALELVPAADQAAGRTLTAAGLVVGAVLYLGADAALTRDPDMAMTRHSGHAAAAGAPMPMMTLADPKAVARGETIAAGIVVDGIPESLALGLAITQGEGGFALLAAVVLGNVTESYGAAQPLLVGGKSRRFTIGLIGGIAVVLGAATIVGGTVLATLPGAVVGTAQAVAAGAVLAVLSISIIPYAFVEVNRRVAIAITLGVVAGYLLG